MPSARITAPGRPGIIAADEADLAAGKTIGCLVQIIASEFYLTGGAGSETPLEVWRRTFAPGATGISVRSGHFVAEENPSATLAALQDFLRS